MPKRLINAGGRAWSVRLSGRRTQSSRDEVGVVFTSEDDAREERVARYAPVGVKSAELSLAGLSDRELTQLLARSQPSWTSPELGYRR